MTSINEIKKEIRAYYHEGYVPQAIQQRRGLFIMEGVAAIGGYLGFAGAIAAAGLAYILTGPLGTVPLLWYGGMATAGLAGMGVSALIGRKFRKIAGELMEQDIANFKLVREYLNDVIPGKRKKLEASREQEEARHRGANERFDSQQVQIEEQRRAALQLVADNVQVLEDHIQKEQEYLASLRQEAGKVLGPGFAAASQKPQLPVPEAASPQEAGLTRSLSGGASL